MSVGLVLGAGGVAGASFHAGALSVLDLDLGWDARDATVIVGTSAGAVTGGLLRSGYRASDIAALVVGSPDAAEHPSVRDGILARPVFPAVSPWDFVRLPRFPPVRSWVTRPHRVRLRHLAAGLVGDGRRTLVPAFAALHASLPEWPDRELWICAARYDSLARTVFGRDGAPSAAPVDAIAASCAVPGIFAPVTVDGARYVDGGVHSPTNADVLEQFRALDVVVVVSPLSGRAPFPSTRWAVERFAGAHLTRELARLDVPVLVLEPTREVAAHLALDPTDDTHDRDVIREAFLTSSEWLHGHRAAEAVEILRSCARSASPPTGAAA